MSDEIAARVARARAGEAAAFAELFAEHEASVARVCRRLVGDLGPDEVEDATSEIFLRARRGIEGYDPARPLGPWLVAIAGNYCVDRLRRVARERKIFDAPLAPDDEAAADPGPSPLGALVFAERRRELLDAIDALPPQYRLPLVLRYFSELDYARIAELLDATPQQVGTLLYRAKRKLREALSGASP